MLFVHDSHNHGASSFGGIGLQPKGLFLTGNLKCFLKDNLLTPWPPQTAKDAEDKSQQWLLLVEAVLPTQAG